MYEQIVCSSRMSTYNLRNKNIELPVQIQLSDQAFMSTVLGDSQPTPGQGQGRHENSSDSEADLSLEKSGTDGGLADTEQNEVQNDRDQAEAGPSTDIDQNLINQTILEQLTNIGKRLENLEKTKSCKKTADKNKTKGSSASTRAKQNSSNEVSQGSRVGAPNLGIQNQNTVFPQPEVLRQNVEIQKQVEQRLRELTEQKSGSEKLKSQRGGRCRGVCGQKSQVASRIYIVRH